VRIAERLHLVGSGETGLALTDRLDAQVYLLETAEGLVCIDAGTGRSVDAILAAVRSDGLDPARIGWLLLTHGHADHAAGAAAWRARLPGLRIGAEREAAAWLEAGDEEATSLDRARRAGLYPPDLALRPCRIDHALDPWAEIRVGDLVLRAVPTPGHARGHLAFVTDVDGRRLLFSGDALFPGGRLLLQDTWDCDLHAALRSVELLATLGADDLLAGHLHPAMGRAAAHLDAAMGRIARLAVPDSIA
jgi:glyoxylase-like metal-dependent hydrolase (beta-lactamase superfamily II)